MTRFIFIALWTIFSIKSSGQIATKCNCGALVNVDFKGKIVVYNKPYGQVVKAFRNNFKNEDFLVLTIRRDSANFFQVDISNALTPKDGKTGWIKKSKEVGTFATNYQQNDTLFLYFKPTLKSKIQSVIPDWTNQLYTITKCYENWVYVTLNYKRQNKHGRLQPDKQCDNPYTTCN